MLQIASNHPRFLCRRITNHRYKNQIYPILTLLLPRISFFTIRPLEINPQDAEQVIFKTARPNPSQGPTPVKFLVYVLNISKVDDSGQNFTANVFLRLRWKDPRLENPNGPIRRVPLEKVWNPQVLIANQLGRVARALPEMVQVQPDGTVIYIQRFTGKFSQELMLANFPTDTHSFAIQFVASGHRVQELTFQPEHLKNIRGGGNGRRYIFARLENFIV